MVDPTTAKYVVGPVDFINHSYIGNSCLYCNKDIYDGDTIFIATAKDVEGPFCTKACLLNRLIEKETSPGEG